MKQYDEKSNIKQTDHIDNIFLRLSYIALIIVYIVLPFRSILEVSEGTSILIPIGFFCALFWGLGIFLTNNNRRIDMFHIILFLFIVWSLLSTIWSKYPRITYISALELVFLLFLMIITYDLIRSESKLMLIFLSYICGLLVIGSYEFQYFLIEGLRIGDLVLSRNRLGDIFVISVPMAYFLYKRRNSFNIPKFGSFILVYIVSAISVVILTRSRSSFLTLVIIIFIFALLDNDFKNSLIDNKYLSFLSIGVLFILFFQFLYSRFADFVISLLAPGSSTDAGRFEIYQSGIEVFVENAPLGLGYGGFVEEVSTHSHNTYINIAAETGVFGLLLLFVLLIYLSKGTLSLNDDNKAVATALIVAWFVMSMFSDYTYVPEGWIMLLSVLYFRDFSSCMSCDHTTVLHEQCERPD